MPPASREDLLKAARVYLASCEPDHPVHDLLNIESPAFGASDLALSNPSRTRLHIARLLYGHEMHRLIMDSLAFGGWIREMLKVSTQLFRTTASFTLYLFAPEFPESAMALAASGSWAFQLELVPYAWIPGPDPARPQAHILKQPPGSSPVATAEPVSSPRNNAEVMLPAEAIPAGLSKEEKTEFLRLERLYRGRP